MAMQEYIIIRVFFKAEYTFCFALSRRKLKPVKPAKIMSAGAVVNFSIFYTAEFRSQIRSIQDTMQPWYSKLEISFSNCLDIQPLLSTF